MAVIVGGNFGFGSKLVPVFTVKLIYPTKVSFRVLAHVVALKLYLKRKILSKILLYLLPIFPFSLVAVFSPKAFLN